MTRASFNLTLKTKAAMDGDQMLVFGLMSCSVAADGTRVVDSQDDVISIAELEKGAYGYTANARGMGVMHDKFQGIGKLIESCVFTAEKIAKMATLGIEITSAPDCWWVGYKVDSVDVWNRVKSGELGSFSWGGFAKRIPVATEKRKSFEAVGIGKSKAGPAGGELFELTDLEIHEGSLVDDPANPKAKVAFFKRASPPSLFQRAKAALAKLVLREPAKKDDAPPPSMNDVLAANEWREGWWCIRDAFDNAVRGILCAGLSAEETAARLQESTQQFLDNLTALNAGGAEKSAVGKLDLGAVDIAVCEFLDKGLTSESFEELSSNLNGLEKAAGAPVRTDKKEQTMPKTAAEILKGLSAEDRAVMETAHKAASSAPVSDEVLKRLDAQEKQLAEVVAKNVALERQNVDLGADLLTQKAATKKADFTATVKNMAVPGKTHEQMVSKLMKLSDEDAKEQIAEWEATSKAMAPLMAPVGSNGGALAADATPAQSELSKAMAELQAKGLSEDNARQAALKANPALAKKIGAVLRAASPNLRH